jgi:uncharacterized membrane protein YqhA
MNIKKEDCNLLIDDLSKVIVFIIIIHLLRIIVENSGDLMDDQVLKYLLYSSIALIFYHIIFKQLVLNKFIYHNTTTHNTTTHNRLIKKKRKMN